MTGLEVWLDDREAGWLKPLNPRNPLNPFNPGEATAPRLALGYLEAWTSEAPAYPLAPCLPMPARGGAGTEIGDAAVTAFFDHLLPEGPLGAAVGAALGLAPGDTFGALLQMGRDTAGALRLIADDRRLRPSGPGERLLSREELSERLRHPDAPPLAVWDGQVRHALAGRQDKLGVYVDGGGDGDGDRDRDGARWLLVDGPQVASTHLLKPAPRAAATAATAALRDQPFNEFFCMRLAARVGLDVARVQLHQLPEPVLRVERFDRQRLDDGRVRRLHVIDGCQALGVPVAQKGSVGLPQLFGLLAHSASPLIEGRALLRWTIFQVLIGNHAAHAKDLSFFVDHGGLRVAPAYDLLCTPPLGAAEGHAMAIGGAVQPDDIDAEAWARFAAACGLAPRSLALELTRLSAAVREQAEALAAELGDVLPRGVADGILSVTTAICDRQAALAPSIPKASADGA